MRAFAGDVWPHGWWQLTTLRRRPPAHILINALALHAATDAARVFLENLIDQFPKVWPEARVTVVLRQSTPPLPSEDVLEVIRIRSAQSGVARVADELVRLPRILAALQPDAFISPNESIPWRVRAPLVVVAQNLFFHCPEIGPSDAGPLRTRLRSRLQFAFYRHQMPRAYARADAVVPVSRHAAHELAQHAGLDLGRVHVVPYGADRLPVRPRSSQQGRRRLLVVGTIAHYKRLEHAIRALRTLLQGHRDYELALAGGEWPGQRAKLERVAHAEGVKDHVTFLGPVSGNDLAELFASSHVGLSLSACETFGIPVVEGMRAGLPHVVADEPWSAETVGDAAIRVQGTDPRAIAEGIRELEDPAEWERMAELGRAATARYTWEANAAGIADVAARMLHDRERRPAGRRLPWRA